MMGDIPVTIQVVASEKEREKVFGLIGQAFEAARAVEFEVSEWHGGSDASLLNSMAGLEPIKIGRHLMNILLYAERVSAGTDGAFDVTFASKNPASSYLDLQIKPYEGTARLTKPDMTIGVSGIAKGYIVDQIAGILKGGGFANFLVNAGGDLYAAGEDINHRWQVSIRDPRGTSDGPPRCQVRLKDLAASTSGSYERGDHIIDPKTRLPAATDLASATVIAPSSLQADTLATGIFVMGKKRGLPLLKEIRPGGGVLIDQRGEVSVIGDLDCVSPTR